MQVANESRQKLSSRRKMKHTRILFSIFLRIISRASIMTLSYNLALCYNRMRARFLHFSLVKNEKTGARRRYIGC